MTDEPLNNSENMEEPKVERNEKGQLQKGSILNPKGKPKGAKHFNTYFIEAIKQVATANNQTEQQVMIDLVKSGLLSAIKGGKGGFLYWEEIFDRLDGKPAQTIHNSYDDEVESVTVNIIKSNAPKPANNDNLGKEQSSQD